MGLTSRETKLMSAAKVFLDTNILLYSLDARDIRKRDIARELLEGLCKSGGGYISLQVVNEFASNLIRKFGRSPAEVDILCEGLSDLKIESGSMNQIREALRIMTIASISYWDACVVASAALAGCRTIYTEDLQTDQVIAGVRIVNPFR
jgi:predicted nucleic acid-binding protein